MKNILVTVALCLVSVSAFAKAAGTYSSPAGDRTITADIAGHVIYRSANGVLDIQVTKEGIKIGDFTLKASNATREGDVTRSHVVIENGSDRVEDDLVANERTNELTGQHLSRVNEIARSFAMSEEGQLLQEAKELIASSKTQRDDPNGGDGGRFRIRPTDFWGCMADILNAVAAGAAMIGGCGTPACGPYIIWCCTSGVAWFVASLISIVDSGDCLWV
jgi:hypothetical protein